MRNLLILFLVSCLPFGASAQTAPATSDLRQLAEAIQAVAKPSAGHKLPPLPPAADPKQIRMVSFSTLPEWPLPVLLDNRPIPFDSLNNYCLNQVSSVALNRDTRFTAIYGASGSWGVLDVKLKKQPK
ncbi:MAG: hypothetical protein ACRYF0_00845 [Janthinobacterium lividum]